MLLNLISLRLHYTYQTAETGSTGAEYKFSSIVVTESVGARQLLILQFVYSGMFADVLSGLIS